MAGQDFKVFNGGPSRPYFILYNPTRPSQGAASYEAAAGSIGNMEIMRQLTAYLLPKDNPEYRWRIGGALGLLVAAKSLNVAVRALPFAAHGKSAVDVMGVPSP